MVGFRGVKAGEFDRSFDAGEDISSDLDVESARRPVRDARDVDVPEIARPGDSPGPGLRDRILRTRPEELGFVADSDFPDVYGVVVDWPLGVEVASILALRDGSASLYTTSKFGIIGGGGHASVRAAAQDCVRVAAGFLERSVSVTQYRLPPSTGVNFYLLTYSGVRHCAGDLDAISSGADPTTPLFGAAQDVLTQLRLITESRSKRWWQFWR